MDAKTAVKVLKSESCINCEISPKIADYIEQQAKQIKQLENTEFQREQIFLNNRKYAELGRLAVEISKLKNPYWICPPEMFNFKNKKENMRCGGCRNLKFCQLRAELLADGRE